MPNAERETAVVVACQRELTRRRAWWINVHGTGHGRNGTPDLIACYRGRFLAIECKRPRGGRVSPLQSYEIHRIRHAGGDAFVATGVDELRAALDYLDRRIDAA